VKKFDNVFFMDNLKFFFILSGKTGGLDPDPKFLISYLDLDSGDPIITDLRGSRSGTLTTCYIILSEALPVPIYLSLLQL